MQSQHQRRHFRRSTQPLHLEALEGRHLLSTYTLRDLGSFGNYSVAYAINDAGMVVGESQAVLFDAVHAFLWDAVSGMQDLGTLGGRDSTAYAINSKGVVVGRASSSDSGNQHAFLYNGGPLMDLGTLGGGTAWAKGINNADQVVGFSYTESGFYHHAFLWDTEHGMRDLGTLGGTVSAANGINDSGSVVGFSYAPNDIEPFLWDSDSGMRQLGTLGGRIYNSANAINAPGHVVGASERADQYTAAFFYDGTKMFDLGPPSPSLSAATAINDSDQIVGILGVNGIITTHGFVYADGQLTDLNDLIPPDSGFIVTAAHGINNAGQIVGVAQDVQRREHAVLLTPEESLSPRHLDAGVFHLWVASTESQRAVDTGSARQTSPTPRERALKAALPQAGPGPRQAADVVFSGDKFSANRYVTAPLSLESDWLPLPE